MPLDPDSYGLDEKYPALYEVAPNCFKLLMEEVHDIDRDNYSSEKLAEEVAELAKRLELRNNADMDNQEIKAEVISEFNKLGLRGVLGHVVLSAAGDKMAELIEVRSNREADRRVREYQVTSYSNLVDKLYASIERSNSCMRRIEDSQAAVRPIIVTNLIAAWIVLGLTALAVARLFS